MLQKTKDCGTLLYPQEPFGKFFLLLIFLVPVLIYVLCPGYLSDLMADSICKVSTGDNSAIPGYLKQQWFLDWLHLSICGKLQWT